ncbi:MULTISPECIES: hypothetical protein [Micromonospora]|uniref:Uncharacterized protein n=1 Tax=Micromonospora solifontis TaxID=2487138 RepID=A0ABX9WKK9_9ACTN|nr:MULTISPECIES: hypothetical protein [Micromonospora]NES14802.1 hypothetical protein [Micromonospora sp. PPF5-17B]NES35366.1 hypothetical protein [Micromonospora solifontis]NES56152.1 hypothetical protein [Micromonospora sp. PPF5-6]RNM00860.1 hypothetical protein EFE23_04205 [Micromonospora solifontis]
MLLVLFVYFLVTVPAFIGLALVAQLSRAAWAKRASEVVLLTGVAALIPVVLDRALDRPVLWLFVALLVVVLVFGAAMHVRSYRRPS